MTEGMAPSFGEMLRQLRTDRGFGLREFARLIHYSPGYVSKIEHGEQPPTLAFAEACDHVLDPSPRLTDLAQLSQRQAARFQLVRPAQLPPTVGDFVGREAHLTTLNGLLDSARTPGVAPVAVIAGAPGMGKTATALRWAHDHADRFPDGALFANLRGFDLRGVRVHPTDVLEDWLRDLGVPANRIPVDVDARATLLRSLLDQRSMLVVLDNVASSDQILPLLPSSSRCAVLITTRVHLVGIGAAAAPITLTLDGLSPEESRALLDRIVGSCRLDAEPTATDALIACCSRLPLALRIAGQFVATHPHDSISALTAQLSTEADGLGAFEGTEDTPSVRAAFSWSYQALTPAAQTLFQYLGLHPSTELSLPAAAALAGVPERAAWTLLDQLTEGHLIDSVGPQRYRFHDLLGAYAAEQASSELSSRDRHAAVTRVVGWYTHTACRANDVLAPQRGQPELPDLPPQVTPMAFTAEDYDRALAWCELEADNLLAVTELAHEHRLYEHAWLLPVVQFHHHFLRKLWRHWIRGTNIGLMAARAIGDQLGEAWCLHNIGAPHRELRRFHEALGYLERAVEIRTEIDDQWGLGWSLFALGLTYADLARLPDAEETLERSCDVFTAMGFDYGLAASQTWLGTVQCQLGDVSVAMPILKQALARFERLQADEGCGITLAHLGLAECERQDTEAALHYLDRSLAIRQRIEDRSGEAEVYLARGQVLRRAGDQEAARQAFLLALDMFEDLLDPRVADARAELATLDLGEIPEQPTASRRLRPGRPAATPETLARPRRS